MLELGFMRILSEKMVFMFCVAAVLTLTADADSIHVNGNYNLRIKSQIVPGSFKISRDPDRPIIATYMVVLASVKVRTGR